MAIASTTAATQLGRATFTSLIKLIPGAGTIVGGVIGAGVASTFTYAMGQAWLTLCQRVVKASWGPRAPLWTMRSFARFSWRSFGSGSRWGARNCAQHPSPIPTCLIPASSVSPWSRALASRGWRSEESNAGCQIADKPRPAPIACER